MKITHISLPLRLIVWVLLELVYIIQLVTCKHYTWGKRVTRSKAYGCTIQYV